MTAAVLELIANFERLSDSEQREAVSELVRRTPVWDSGPLSDDELIAAAETLFLQLDAEEASHDSTATR